MKKIGHLLNKKLNKTQIILGLLLSSVLNTSTAADFTVNQTFDGADAAPGDGVCATVGDSCTLRAAVMETNALAGADRINLSAGTYTIALGNTDENLAAEGDLDILDDLIITGADPATTQINGNAFKFRVFSILPRADNSLPVVSISNVTLTQGLADGSGALLYNAGNLTLDNVTLTDANADGWAMVSDGDFVLKNSRVNNNSKGVFSRGGTITIINSEFRENVWTSSLFASALSLSGTAAYVTGSIFSANESVKGNFGSIGDGGAILATAGSTLSVDSCQFTDNKSSASTAGGAITAFSYVRITNSTFTGNESGGSGGALYFYFAEADIFASSFENNIAADSGGAIFAWYSTLKIKQVVLSGNSASVDAGAIYLDTTATVQVFSENIIRNNSAAGLGGGIVVASDTALLIQNSEISNNTAAYGGGVYSSGLDQIFVNVTITGNTATVDGGGLYQDVNGSSVELVHVTLSDNTAPVSKANNVANLAGVVRLNNSLISSASGINCSGSITTLGYNLSSDASCELGVEGDQINTAPLLSGLADNGGFSQTRALQVNSPAIDAASPAVCASLNPVDQRYFYRGDSACDIGAYEADSVQAQSGLLAFSVANIDVDEDAATATVTLTRTGGSEGNVSVFVYDSGLGTADPRSPVSDYDLFSGGWLDWLDGDSSDKTFDITINDDSKVEIAETILLEMADPFYVLGSAGLGLAATSVTIIDNESAGEINIESSTYSVSEGVGTLDIMLSRTNGSDGEVVFLVSFIDETAIFDSDYRVFNSNGGLASSGTVMLREGETSFSLATTIIDDGNLEADEVFSVLLSDPTGGLTLGSTVSATVTIVDNDGLSPGEVNIESSTYSVNEGVGTLNVVMNRTNGSDGQVTFVASLTDDSALFGSDYSAVNNSGVGPVRTVMFEDGETRFSWAITIVDDGSIEPDEVFTVLLSDPTGGLTLGSTVSATVTVLDDDVLSLPGEVNIASSKYSVDEGVGTLTIVLERTNGSDGEVSFLASLINDTALFGSDYSAVNNSGVGSARTVMFEDGETSFSWEIIIIDDETIEADEAFNVALSDPTGGLTLGSTVSATVEITDNDIGSPGEINIESSTYSVSEGVGTLNIVMNRTNGSDGTVIFIASLMNGTAIFGSDFSAANSVGTGSFGKVTLEDGETSFSWTISIIDDDALETDEEFKVVLSTPFGGISLGSVASATITIIDNDSADESSSGGSSSDSSNNSGGGALNPLLVFGLLLILIQIRRAKLIF